MKKHGDINQFVSEAIAAMGHTDTLVICDAGFPIPIRSNKIDISLVFNVPTLLQTIKAVLSELIVEKAILPAEMEEHSLSLFEEIHTLLTNQSCDTVPFDRFLE